MRKGLKITISLLGLLIIIMLFAPFLFKGKIEAIVKQEGNKMLNAQFDFESLDISLFKHFPKASISLNDFWLKGINEFENDTLLNAGEVNVAVNLMSLFGNKGIEISTIAIEDTHLKAIALENGAVNWDIMKISNETEKVEEDTTASAFNIQLKKLTLDNLNLTYDDRQAHMLAVIEGLKAGCTGDFSSKSTVLKLTAEIERLTYKMNGIPFLNKANLTAKMDIAADLANQKFVLKDNRLTLNAIETTIDGWAEVQTNGAIGLDLSLNTNEIGFKEILSLIPAIYTKDFAGLKTDGSAILTAKAKGSLQGDSIVPAFEIAMDVKNGMFHYPSLPAGVEGINIHANIQNPGGSPDATVVDITPFSFNIENNPFTINANVTTPMSDLTFKANAKGTLDLNSLAKVYPLENMQLNGIIKADLQLAGKNSFIEKEQYDRIQADGTIAINEMKVKMKDLPNANIHQSLFTFSPKSLKLSETTLNLGENDITAQCQFENYLGYALKGTTLKGTLNIQSNHMDLNDFMSSTPTEESTTTEKETESEANSEIVSLIEIPKNIDFEMHALFQEVTLDNMVINNVKGDIDVRNGIANMQNLSLNALGGDAILNGYYSTANIKEPVFNANFQMNNISFAQTYKDLNVIRLLAPIFENLKGSFGGKMQLQTVLDQQMNPILNTIQGYGNLTTKDLSLSNVKVIDQIADALKKPNLKNMNAKDLNIEFNIHDGRIDTKPFDIKLGDYVINMSGSTGLDQSIDYLGKIQLPATNKTPISTIDLKIKGNFKSPKVSVDMASMATQAVESLKGEAAKAIEKKLGIETNDKDSIKEEIKGKAAEKIKGLFKKKKK